MGMQGRKYYKADNLQSDSEEESPPGPGGDRYPVKDINEANLVSSEHFSEKYHLPILDLDCSHHYVPSSTPGHGHLYINVPVDWPKYVQLLELLGELGILGSGYVRRSIERGATFVRKPGVKK